MRRWSLGNGATKSTTLTKDLTFDENLTLRNGDVFNLNSDAAGGISFAQASVGGAANIQQLYAGLLGDTFVGAPLDSQPNVNWRGVLSIIAGLHPRSIPRISPYRLICNGGDIL